MVEMIKVFLISAAALAVTFFVAAETERISGPLSSSKSNLKIKWIEQKLDHFNKSDTRTCLMRYMANDEFYVPGGPVFIVVGGEKVITPYFITNGLFYDTAREHNASLFFTEHRFYGKSRPVQNMTNENLKYLNVQQALADLAHFIRTIKSSSPSMNNSKVILAGSHYSGAMVTWFKKLYPDLAVGCWASSAPLLAKLDFNEYKKTAGQSIRLVGGDSCYNRIANGINEMEEMIKNNRSAELKSALNICHSFDENNEWDVAILFTFISKTFTGLVQYHENNTIQIVCKKIMEGPDDFKSLSNFILHIFGNESCTDCTYKTELAVTKNIIFGNTIDRQFYYQMCNEFGWFSTTTSKQQPFGTKMPLRFYTDLCKDVFGDKFTLEFMERQVNKTNQLFGGLNPQVENVYMTYGQLDPWLPLGIQDVNKATIIPMASHISDSDSISDKDSNELRAAKIKIKQKINDWLRNK